MVYLEQPITRSSGSNLIYINGLTASIKVSGMCPEEGYELTLL